MESYQGGLLALEIIERSEAAVWSLAKLEWELVDVFFDDDLQKCLCGHYPIKEICIIKNRENLREVIVGNHCVKKFMGLTSDKIFTSIKRVRSDISKSVDGETLQHAYRKNWINDWEFKFYISIMRKRKLTEKQRLTKEKVNSKMLTGMCR